MRKNVLKIIQRRACCAGRCLNGEDDCDAGLYAPDAARILAGLEAAGYAVVPVEPTKEMMIAFSNTLMDPKLRHSKDRVKEREGYKAMIAAAKETGDD